MQLPFQLFPFILKLLLQVRVSQGHQGDNSLLFTGIGYLSDRPSAVVLQCLIRSHSSVAVGRAAGRWGQRHDRDQNRKNTSNPKGNVPFMISWRLGVLLSCHVKSTEWRAEHWESAFIHCLQPRGQVGPARTPSAFQAGQSRGPAILPCVWGFRWGFPQLYPFLRAPVFLLEGIITFHSVQSWCGGKSRTCVLSFCKWIFQAKSSSLHFDPEIIFIAFQKISFLPKFAGVSFYGF